MEQTGIISGPKGEHVCQGQVGTANGTGLAWCKEQPRLERVKAEKPQQGKW